MLNDKACLGVEKDRLMIRLHPLRLEEVIENEGPGLWILPVK